MAASDAEWGSIASSSVDKESRSHLTDCKAQREDGEIEDTADLAIVGGGIAGLSLAAGLASLRKDRKFTVRLYERAPQLRTKSQGMLALRKSGLQSLAGIHPDLPNEVRKVGAALQTMQSSEINAEGNTVGPKTRQLNKDEEGNYDVLIAWSDLQNVLASFIPADGTVEIKTDRSLVSFQEFPDSVVLTFDGGERVRCKAVVGCDGIFSRVRQQLYASRDDRVIYFGQLNWNAIVPTESLPGTLHPPDAVTVHASKHPVNWSSFVNDAGSGKTFWQIRVSDPKKALALSGSGGRGGLGLAGTKERLMSIVEKSEVVSAVLRSTPEEDIFERCILGRKPAPGSWQSAGGRVVLMGDAAHAMHPAPGYGGNSAIQGAFTLKVTVSECDAGDWKSAFRMYEEKFRRKADVVQRFSNCRGCNQANSGISNSIPPHLMKEMNDWLDQLEPGDPSAEVLNALESFDPLDTPGVSYV